MRCGGDIQLEVVWILEYLILELRTEIWDKKHHPWECRIMRNEDAGQRVKEHYYLPTKPRKMVKRRIIGVESGRKRKAKKGGDYQEKNPKCQQ